MYSPYFFCFYLRFDAGLSQRTDVDRIKDYLKQVDQLREVDRITYESVDTFPGIRLILLHAITYSSWAGNDSINTCNLIYIEGAKFVNSEPEALPASHARYVALLKKIADLLGWEVVEDETEDGIEDLVRYKPPPLIL